MITVDEFTKMVTPLLEGDIANLSNIIGQVKKEIENSNLELEQLKKDGETLTKDKEYLQRMNKELFEQIRVAPAKEEEQEEETKEEEKLKFEDLLINEKKGE
jgi:hypothetical protein